MWEAPCLPLVPYWVLLPANPLKLAVQSKVLKCFVLNGAIFLGSTLMLENVVDPAVSWMLQAALADWASDGFIMGAISVLRAVYTCLWLVPAYAISFLVNCLW